MSVSNASTASTVSTTPPGTAAAHHHPVGHLSQLSLFGQLNWPSLDQMKYPVPRVGSSRRRRISNLEATLHRPGMGLVASVPSLRLKSDVNACQGPTPGRLQRQTTAKRTSELLTVSAISHHRTQSMANHSHSIQTQSCSVVVVKIRTQRCTHAPQHPKHHFLPCDSYAATV